MRNEITRVLNGITICMKKNIRRDRVELKTSKASNSICSNVVPPSDEKYGLKERRIGSSTIAGMDINHSMHSLKEKLRDEPEQIDGLREHKPTLTSKILNEKSNMLEQLKEVVKMQHEDMKAQFQNYGIEIEKRLQAHQNETKNRFTRTEEMMTTHIKELRNETKIQHRDIRRRFERVECKANKGYFN